MTRIKLAALWIVLQVIFFGAWSGREAMRLSEGRGESILVRTAPVDPRDFLSGQFIQLSYEFSNPGRWRTAERADFKVGADFTGRADFTDGDEVWVVLARVGEFHVPTRAQRARPEGIGAGQVALRGAMERWLARFGVERYFVPEGTATPDQRDITVRLRVGTDGEARIERVFVKGVPWP